MSEKPTNPNNCQTCDCLAPDKRLAEIERLHADWQKRDADHEHLWSVPDAQGRRECFWCAARDERKG